jgi:hypothetical protein
LRLKTLFTKTATTMPRGAPGSLGDNVYLDIVAHLLKENGFAAGPRELTADALDGIRVVPGRPKPPPPIGDFSYVDVVGCLTGGPQHTWMLTQASEPVAAVPAAPGGSAPAVAPTPLGTRTIRLVDAIASEVHATGEVWTNLLFECYVALLRDSARYTFAQAQRVTDTVTSSLLPSGWRPRLAGKSRSLGGPCGLSALARPAAAQRYLYVACRDRTMAIPIARSGFRVRHRRCASFPQADSRLAGGPRRGRRG